LFFSARPVRNLDQAKASDSAFFRLWFHALLSEGVYVAPSPFEAGFISSAHEPAVIKATLKASERALERIFCKR
ncbi:MAG: aspartate aminotransferase family protein, partial [bacterium]